MKLSEVENTPHYQCAPLLTKKETKRVKEFKNKLNVCDTSDDMMDGEAMINWFKLLMNSTFDSYKS